MVALVAFLFAERRAANPMMALEIFKSRQFSAANLVTFVVYAALATSSTTPERADSTPPDRTLTG